MGNLSSASLDGNIDKLASAAVLDMRGVGFIGIDMHFGNDTRIDTDRHIAEGELPVAAPDSNFHLVAVMQA